MLRLLPLLLPLMLLLLLLLLLQEVGEDYKYLLKLEPKKQKIIGGNFFFCLSEENGESVGY